jgi:hypothetical protein
MNRVKPGHEVAAEAERELLDLPDRRLLGEGEDGVLLGIGGYDVGVVAGDVDILEIAGERDADVQVAELVALGIPRDRNHPHPGLAVLIGPDDHRSSRQPISREKRLRRWGVFVQVAIARDFDRLAWPELGA